MVRPLGDKQKRNRPHTFCASGQQTGPKITNLPKFPKKHGPLGVVRVAGRTPGPIRIIFGHVRDACVHHASTERQCSATTGVLGVNFLRKNFFTAKNAKKSMSLWRPVAGLLWHRSAWISRACCSIQLRAGRDQHFHCRTSISGSCLSAPNLPYRFFAKKIFFAPKNLDDSFLLAATCRLERA